MPRRFNCCEFNHPCPIFCPQIDFTCSNDVVNPEFTSDFAFFNNTDVGEIASGGIIPVTLVSSQGGSIASSATTSGAVVLSAGIYEINYFAGGTVPEGENITIGLALDGTTVAGSQISVNTTADTTSNLTRTIVVTLMEAATLSLVNETGETVDFSFASIFIRRL